MAWQLLVWSGCCLKTRIDGRLFGLEKVQIRHRHFPLLALFQQGGPCGRVDLIHGLTDSAVPLVGLRVVRSSTKYQR